MAVALMLSLTLVFAAASAGWVASRSSEVQRVADASALAGANAVAAFSTVAQVLDACVLSLGVTGMVVYGAGLVASCVPGLTAVGAQLCATGGQILEARRGFARSAASGLERLEAALPALVVANSASCVAANGEDGLSYVGCALPVPLESGSDFSALLADADDAPLDGLSERMRDASLDAQEARERADEALERGWMADCGSRPHSLHERAGALAGLPSSANPHYPSCETWGFGVPLVRARAYYAARLANERVVGSTPEELTNAACRRAFYEYALGRVRSGSWAEHPDGTVEADLPLLPRNADETRATELYTRVAWPCTDEGGSRTLHSSLDCPGATGGPSGSASLAQLDAGAVSRCPQCQMDVGDLGRVASASTSIENGFEHHWRIIVEASEDYEAARDDLAAAEARTRELAEEGELEFERALEQLTTGRPTLRPPGAWGCVAVVARPEGTVVPTELTASFLSSAELPAGAAVSAATLAPDESTAENNVLASFFDSLSASDSVLGGALDGVMELWGSLLVGYGSAHGRVAEVGEGFLERLDGVMGGSVGAWLRDQLGGVMRDLGLEPVDMRLRKPVLTNSRDVLERGGVEQASAVRDLLSRLPDSASVADLARAVGVTPPAALGEGGLTVAELPIPGTGISIPLSVDLTGAGGLP
ncbi:MAG TPA: hypothetical protein IAA40_03265 [Candidatus Olsenella excrementigallinarum]|nr:hypothetical protein [Candidatus Olsenella excrementigallinarum]